MLQFALKYIHEGFHIFPLQPGKKIPFGGTNGVSDATNDEAQIKEWWTKWPDANIGIATGKSGVIIVDLDGPAGLNSGRSMQLSSPMTVISGKGEQLYFKAIPNFHASVRKMGDGIDIRAENTYGILPPSLHPNGKRYAVKTWSSIASLPQLPESLVAKESQLQTNYVKRDPDWMIEALNKMEIGNVDDTLTSVLGRLRVLGHSEAVAFELLRYHPKMSLATPGHLEGKIKHIWNRYPAGQREEIVKASNIADFLKDEVPVEWLVPQIIAKKSISFVAGLQETMKTWLLLDLAISMANSRPSLWLNAHPVKPGRVLFIDQERFKGETQRRLNALIVGRGLRKEELQENLFVKCGTTIDLHLENSYKAFREELLEMRPDLILIDSFAAFHSAAPNDAQSIRVVLERIKAIRNEIGCAIVFIAHEGKGTYADMTDNVDINCSRIMGSTAIAAALEGVLIVRPIEPGVKSMVYHGKSTLSQKIPAFAFTVRDLESGGTVVEVIE